MPKPTKPKPYDEDGYPTSYWDNDTARENPIHEAEREESRDALRAEPELGRSVSCGHMWLPNRRGGLTCRWCGDDVDADEI